MRKIRIIEHISLDGVIQAPGGPDEDRDGGFEHGGWVVPFSDPVVGQAILGAHQDRFDLLLGRGTYDIWAPYWPHQSGPMADSLNAATKYIATHRPESLSWGPVKSLGADIVEGVRRLKESEGPDLILWGSSSLPPVLLGNGLADEVLLLIYPVLLGRGKRFFSDPAVELSLVESKAGVSGVLVNTYRPAGPLRTGSFASDGD
jgi:dihydrofolate reductase